MTLQQTRRNLFEMVASGRVSPDDAARLLDALQRSPLDESDQEAVLGEIASEKISAEQAIERLAPNGSASSPRNERNPTDVRLREGRSIHDDDTINAIRVSGTFRTLRVEGDTSVRGAVAEGPHEVRNKDGVLVFEDYADEDDPGFTLFGPRFRRGRIQLSGKINGKEFSFGENVPHELRIRMNPELPLEIDLTAGSARVRDVSGPIRATLAAGTARFEGIQSPFVAVVDAGSLNVHGLFDRGESEIRCTAGKVRIELDEESSVRITARATLGKISLPHKKDWAGIGGGRREVIVGEGKGTLDIEATTGAAVVEMAKESRR
jgi:hypothetical protein